MTEAPLSAPHRRRALAALAAALAFGALTSGAMAAGAPGTINKGVLTVAYRTDDKPVSFIADGKPAGFLVEFMQAIAAQLHLGTSFVSTGFAAMLPAVKNGQYDTAAFATLVTPAREKMVDFTKPVGYEQARLVVPEKAPIARVEDAAGKTVGITQGSALIPLLERIAPGVKVREFPNIASSLNALIAGQVDGLFTGLATADRVAKQHPGLTTSQTVTSGVAAFPVAKGNPELRAALDAAITKLMNDGTFTSLFTRWNPPDVRIPAELYRDYPGMPRQKPAPG